MTRFLTAAAVSLALLLLSLPLGCEYLNLESEVDEETAILTPPSVREIIDDADGLGLGPKNLLRRRRDAAHEDLDELYQDRKDEARNDRAITRLGAQLDRARTRLDDNYDRRQDRLEERLARDES